MLSAEDCSISRLFVKNTIEEPFFDEVVLVYRRKNAQNQGDKDYSPNPQGINIQRFYNIPMKDIKMIFPTKQVGKNMADYFYYCLILSWILTTIFKLQSAWANSTYIDEFLIAILFILSPFLLRYLTRIIFENRASRRTSQRVNETLQKNSLNCSKSVISYLHASAHAQQFKELVIAYYVVWKWGEGITVEELDAACESLLKGVFGVVVDFKVDTVLERLEMMKLVRKEGEKYFVEELLQSVEILEEKLINTVTSAFNL